MKLLTVQHVLLLLSAAGAVLLVVPFCQVSALASRMFFFALKYKLVSVASWFLWHTSYAELRQMRPVS